MMCVFLLSAIVIVFLAYREYKGMFYDRMGAGGSMFSGMGGGRN
jgi:hypothetical protein